MNETMKLPMVPYSFSYTPCGARRDSNRVDKLIPCSVIRKRRKCCISNKTRLPENRQNRYPGNSCSLNSG